MLTATHITPVVKANSALAILYNNILSVPVEELSHWEKCTQIVSSVTGTALSHLGQSDHSSLSAYSPLLKNAHFTTRTVKTLPEGASQQLQECFSSTFWDVFEDQNLVVLRDSVLCYIKLHRHGHSGHSSNRSHSQSTILAWLKSSTIVPLPKKSQISLNDYRQLL